MRMRAQLERGLRQAAHTHREGLIVREWLKTCGRLASQSWKLFWMNREIARLKKKHKRNGLGVIDGGKKSGE